MISVPLWPPCRSHADAGNADELSAAQIPAFAAALAPHDARANANRAAALARNRELDFAVQQLHVVDQADAGRRDLAGKRRISATIGRVDRDATEKRIAEFSA